MQVTALWFRLTSVSFLIHYVADESCTPAQGCLFQDGLSNRIARTLFVLVDQEIVLLHGFIKKQPKTPTDELDLAKKRKKQYLQEP